MPELNQYRHFYLYAKGWYNRGDIIEDLKIIQGKWCGIEPQFITKADIASVLTDIIYPTICKNKHQFSQFLGHISPGQSWKIGYPTKGNLPYDTKGEYPEYDYYTALIQGCLSILCLSNKEEFGELGSPDFSILSPKLHERRIKKL